MLRRATGLGDEALSDLDRLLMIYPEIDVREALETEAQRIASLGK